MIFKKIKKANFVLGLLLVSEGLSRIFNEMEGSEIRYIFPHIIDSNLPLLFAIGPLIYFYTKSLTNPVFIIRSPKNRKHLIVFLSFIILYLPFYIQNGEYKLYLISTKCDWFVYIRIAMSIFSRFYVLFYLALSFKVLRIYKNELKDNFSSITNLEMKWLTHFLILICVLKSISLLDSFSWLVHLKFTNQINLFSAPVIYFLLVYYTFKYSAAVSSSNFFRKSESKTTGGISNPQSLSIENNPASANFDKYKTSALTTQQVNEYFQQLVILIKSKKLYTNPDLNLKLLSDQIKLPPHQLSQVINQGSGKNFFEFINAYRIDEAKALLINNMNLKIEAIAFDAGFSSKPSFYSFFKKYTGTTPVEYRKIQSNLP